MSSTHFNVKFKELSLPQASITLEFHSDINEMTVSTNGPVIKNLYISHAKTYLRTSNNYFDLLPGHPVKMVVYHPDGLRKLKEGLKFVSYREVYTKDSSVIVKKK
jgi:L-rhamnose isomerase